MQNDNYTIFNKVWGRKEGVAYINVSGGSRWLEKRIGDVIKRNHLPRTVSKVIDVGCGDGTRIHNVMKNIPDAYLEGYDFSETGIEYANEMYASNKAHFFVGDVTKLKIEKKIDLVTAFGILEHLENWKEFSDSIMKCGGMDPSIY